MLFSDGPIAVAGWLRRCHQRPEQVTDQRDDADLQGEAKERGEAAETATQAAAEQQADQAGAEQSGKQAAHEARTIHQAGGGRLLQCRTEARLLPGLVGCVMVR